MKYIILLWILLSYSCIFGQTKNVMKLDGKAISTTEIDQTVTKLMNNANVQGLNLAILNNNKTIFIKSYGFKNKP